MIALVQPTGATGDLITAIQDADVRVPLAAVALDQAETVRLMPRPASSGADGQIPVYDIPEAAAAALAHAARYGAWRTEPHGQVPSFPDVRAADARALVTGFLHREPGGGWLPPGQDRRPAALLRDMAGRRRPGRERRRGGQAAGRCPARWCSRPRCQGSCSRAGTDR